VINRLFSLVWDKMIKHQWLVLIVASAGMVVASSGLPFQRVDMSFAPFFVKQDDALRPTEEFEAVFGPIDQTHVAVVLENQDVLAPGFLSHVARLSEEVEAVEGVTEVVSLTHVGVPVWTGSTVDVKPIQAGQLRNHPAVQRVLLSADAKKTLVLIRIDTSLRDVEARQPLLDGLRRVIASNPAADTEYRLVGASVVEEQYAVIVQRNLAISLVLNIVALTVVLLILFRRVATVTVALCGVAVATPMTLGVMHYLGQPITIVNSMVSTMVMIIGVADAIHMLQCFHRHHRGAGTKEQAIRRMFIEMSTPCLLTTVTTALGFLSLRMAGMAAMADFGLNVAIGVVLVYLANLICIPFLLRALPERWLSHPGVARHSLLARGIRRVSGAVVHRPVAFLTAALIVGAIGVTWLPHLKVDQRFNEDVDASHSVRADQVLLEQEFTGFLGPVVCIHRKDDSSLLTTAAIARIRSYQQAVSTVPEVLLARSFLDYLPAGVPQEEIGAAIAQLRAHPKTGAQVRELIDPTGSWIGIQVRNTDMGTLRAEEFEHHMASLAAEHLGADFSVELVGQWWLAQGGMQRLLRDMLVSFATSCLLVLVVLAMVVRNVRLFLVGILPNLLPMVLALAFMALAGITVRIGTAMVLAIALGIAIDDTVHFLVGLREETDRGTDPRLAVRLAMTRAGSGIVYSSIVLVLGFLTMLLNELLAIRDMGLVAAVTIVVALAADLLLAPALYMVIFRRRQPAPAPTHPSSRAQAVTVTR